MSPYVATWRNTGSGADLLSAANRGNALASQQIGQGLDSFAQAFQGQEDRRLVEEELANEQAAENARLSLLQSAEARAQQGVVADAEQNAILNEQRNRGLVLKENAAKVEADRAARLRSFIGGARTGAGRVGLASLDPKDMNQVLSSVEAGLDNKIISQEGKDFNSIYSEMSGDMKNSLMSPKDVAGKYIGVIGSALREDVSKTFNPQYIDNVNNALNTLEGSYGDDGLLTPEGRAILGTLEKNSAEFDKRNVDVHKKLDPIYGVENVDAMIDVVYESVGLKGLATRISDARVTAGESVKADRDAFKDEVEKGEEARNKLKAEYNRFAITNKGQPLKGADPKIVKDTVDRIVENNHIFAGKEELLYQAMADIGEARTGLPFAEKGIVRRGDTAGWLPNVLLDTGSELDTDIIARAQELAKIYGPTVYNMNEKGKVGETVKAGTKKKASGSKKNPKDYFNKLDRKGLEDVFK